jgi:uncharacterized membrane protein
MRIVTAVATILVVLFLFNTFTPEIDRPVAAGVSVGLAIAISAIAESKLFGIPLSLRLVLLRGVVAGLVVGLVLTYLER